MFASAPNNKKALTRLADEGSVHAPFAGLYPPGDAPVMMIMAMLMLILCRAIIASRSGTLPYPISNVNENQAHPRSVLESVTIREMGLAKSVFVAL